MTTPSVVSASASATWRAIVTPSLAWADLAERNSVRYLSRWSTTASGRATLSEATHPYQGAVARQLIAAITATTIHLGVVVAEQPGKLRVADASNSEVQVRCCCQPVSGNRLRLLVWSLLQLSPGVSSIWAFRSQLRSWTFISIWYVRTFVSRCSVLLHGHILTLCGTDCDLAPEDARS